MGTAPGIILTGLPGTAKTDMARAMISAGYDFGDISQLFSNSLEHPAGTRMAKRICAVMDMDEANTQHRSQYWAGYIPYRRHLHSNGLRANSPSNVPTGRIPEMEQDFPQVVKISYIGAVPVLCDLWNIKHVVMCTRIDWDVWRDQQEGSFFYSQYKDTPKPDLTALVLHSLDMVKGLLALPNTASVQSVLVVRNNGEMYLEPRIGMEMELEGEGMLDVDGIQRKWMESYLEIEPEMKPEIEPEPDLESIPNNTHQE